MFKDRSESLCHYSSNIAKMLTASSEHVLHEGEAKDPVASRISAKIYLAHRPPNPFEGLGQAQAAMPARSLTECRRICRFHRGKHLEDEDADSPRQALVHISSLNLRKSLEET